MRKLVSRVLVFIAIIAFFPLSVSSAPPAPWEIDELILQPAPDFTLKDLNDNNVSLDDFRGKVVFLNFWATWCPPCKEEMPFLNELHDNYRDKDVVIVGISTDNSKEVIVEFVKKYKVKFSILHDKDSKVSRRYKVFSIPISFLIDKEGTIIEKFLGAYFWHEDEFAKKIDALLD